MVDTGICKRRDGQETNEDGKIVPKFATIYDGKCRFKAQSYGGQNGHVSDPLPDGQYLIMLPFSAPTEIRVNDTFVITASDDAWVVDKPFSVVNVNFGGSAIKRRLLVQEV